jgi:hypothetical protein
VLTNWLPPLGLEYLPAAIEKAGIDTDSVDRHFETNPWYVSQSLVVSVSSEDFLILQLKKFRK